MYILLALAAFVAAAVNSIAGGGTFLTFAALTGVAGLSEKVANMTSTVGLWPGSAASIVAARRDLARLPRSMLMGYAALSLVGGIVGAVLLLRTSTRAFGLAIPWLLAFATAIFAFSKPIARWAGRRRGDRSVRWKVFVATVQLAVSIYGGYFGGGIGVLILAGLSFAGLDDIHQMNALKVLLTTLINGVAAAIFVAGSLTGSEMLGSRGDRVSWHIAGLMIVAASAGGYLGMYAARRVKPNHLRLGILTTAIALTAVYFVRNYG